MKEKFKQMKGIRKKDGITLIALVITIIVLLILAGVSIAMLTGNNGILSQAQKAGEQTEIGEEKEQIALAYNGAKIKKQGGAVTDVDLDEQFSLNDTKADAEGTSPITVTFTESERKYTIDENGVIAGPITGEEQPEEPETPEEPELTLADLQAGDIVYYDTGVSDVGNNGVIKCIKLNYNSILAMDVVPAKFTPGEHTSYDSGNLEFDYLTSTFEDAVELYVNETFATQGRVFGRNYTSDGTLLATIGDNISTTCINGDYALYVDEFNTSYFEDYNTLIGIFGGYENKVFAVGKPYLIPLRSGISGMPFSFERYIQGIDENGKLVENYKMYSSVTSSIVGQDEYFTQLEASERFEEPFTENIRPVFSLKDDVKLEKIDGEDAYILVAE